MFVFLLVGGVEGVLRDVGVAAGVVVASVVVVVVVGVCSVDKSVCFNRFWENSVQICSVIRR